MSRAVGVPIKWHYVFGLFILNCFCVFIFYEERKENKKLKEKFHICAKYEIGKIGRPFWIVGLPTTG
jgi:hypothetical protein